MDIAHVSTPVAFKNGQKNQWRREAWNRIAELTPDRHNALVVYLPGFEDLDRPEALRRGFRDANLIAIERDPETAQSLRCSGRTVIQGDLLETLTFWPSHRKVAVVVADLQSGLADGARNLAMLTQLCPALNDATLLVNLQRGRESGPESQVLIAAMRQMGGTDSYHEALRLWGLCSDSVNRAADRSELAKHRGLWFVTQAFLAQRFTLRHILKEEHGLDEPLAESIVCQVMLGQKGRRAFLLPSYRSTPKSPLFDGVVLKPMVGIPQALASFALSDFGSSAEGRPVRRKIAAALAVSTMRRAGALRRAISTVRATAARGQAAVPQ